MKKLFLTFGLLVACLSLKAATVSVVVPQLAFTNIPIQVTAPLIVTSVVLTSPATTAAGVKFVDTYTNWLLYTNAAYIGVTSYVTNYVTRYTNYYGVVNNFTNIALVDITNTVLGTTNLFNQPLIASVGTNLSQTFPNLGMVFQYGIWVTNTAISNATLTITYTQ